MLGSRVPAACRLGLQQLATGTQAVHAHLLSCACLAASVPCSPPIDLPCCLSFRHPACCSCAGGHWLNLSLTMVDSLDTLYLLGMEKEFEEAARCAIQSVPRFI